MSVFQIIIKDVVSRARSRLTRSEATVPFGANLKILGSGFGLPNRGWISGFPFSTHVGVSVFHTCQAEVAGCGGPALPGAYPRILGSVHRPFMADLRIMGLVLPWRFPLSLGGKLNKLRGPPHCRYLWREFANARLGVEGHCS